MKPCITVLVLSVLFAACSNKDHIPKGVLKQDKMQAVFWDVLRADAFVFQFVTKDSAKQPPAEMAALEQQIFAVHKTSREAFYNSYEYYKAHPGMMSALLDSMINKYTREKYENTKGSKQPGTDTLKAE